MNAEYQRHFTRYEEARQRYMRDLEEIRDLLAQFTGNPDKHEAAIEIRGLTRMEGLRLERDLAYADFVKTEAEIFRALLAGVFAEESEARPNS